MQAEYVKHILHFKRPGGTSRGILTSKETWYLVLRDGHKTGIGECGLLRGLSVDDRPDYEKKLQWVCEQVNKGETWLLEQLGDFPSIQFGVEQAFRSLSAQHPMVLFPSEFSSNKRGIPINGLIWMGDPEFMKAQISDKIAQGFRCLKLKIGAINFESEIEILKVIRSEFSPGDMELRVDANGAFHPDDVMEKLDRLSVFDLHSIEQPVKPGQPGVMHEICRKSPIPIALDEELIGVKVHERLRLLEAIRPQYIILKPSLVGGFKATSDWISCAEAVGAGWWITSALESNIGLNAIAQYTATLDTDMPQGLGTGALYTNNWESPLEIAQSALWYTHKPWARGVGGRDLLPLI